MNIVAHSGDVGNELGRSMVLRLQRLGRVRDRSDHRDRQRAPSRSGRVGRVLTLTAHGGSGPGAVTYALTSHGAAGCVISGRKLKATRAGACTVTVTKAGGTTYLAARSAVSTVTFKATIAPVKLRATRVNGFVWVSRTVNVSIIGTGFYSRPTIRSSEVRTSAVGIHDYGRELVVRVRLPRNSSRGWRVFTIIVANGRCCKVKYFVK